MRRGRRCGWSQKRAAPYGRCGNYRLPKFKYHDAPLRFFTSVNLDLHLHRFYIATMCFSPTPAELLPEGDTPRIFNSARFDFNQGVIDQNAVSQDAADQNAVNQDAADQNAVNQDAAAQNVVNQDAADRNPVDQITINQAAARLLDVITEQVKDSMDPGPVILFHKFCTDHGIQPVIDPVAPAESNPPTGNGKSWRSSAI